MSMGNTTETDILSHILNNATVPLVGDATGLRGSTAAGSLFLALHTADPGEAGDQTTSEIAYTSYVRFTQARGSAWTVTSPGGVGTATLAANTDFAAGTGGSGTATHFSVGTDVSGAGKILFKGTVTPNIVCGNGVTPRLTTASTITLD